MKTNKFKLSLSLFLFTLLVGCNSMGQNKLVKNVAPQEFQNLMKSPDAVVMDVRTPSEVSEGYIKGTTVFVNINGSDFEQKLAALDKSKTYLVYCRSGGRSMAACNQLAANGFTKIYNLQGGISNWTGETSK